MNIINKLFDLVRSDPDSTILKLAKLKSDPTKIMQNAYEMQAKKKGHLSIDEIVEQSKQVKCPAVLTLDALNLAEESESKVLTLENQVIYDTRNFHEIAFDEKEIKEMISLFNIELEANPENGVINVNHSSLPEKAIGLYSNLSYQKVEDGHFQLLATIEIDLSKMAFGEQLESIKDGAKLGFSVELMPIMKGKKLSYKLQGLATTLIPSAAKTLTEIDPTLLDTTEVETEPAMVEEEETEIEVYDKVMNKDNQLFFVLDCIFDTSFKYQDIVVTDSDPVAILQPFDWMWSESDTTGGLSFDNFSNLTKVESNDQPEQLAKINEVKANLTKPVVEPTKLNLTLDTTSLKESINLSITELKTSIEADKETLRAELSKDFESKLQAQKLSNDAQISKLVKVLELNNQTLSTQNNKMANMAIKPVSLQSLS